MKCQLLIVAMYLHKNFESFLAFHIFYINVMVRQDLPPPLPLYGTADDPLDPP